MASPLYGVVVLQYASAILYHNPSQREQAERSVGEQQRVLQQVAEGKSVLTKVLPAKIFYDAEK